MDKTKPGWWGKERKRDLVGSWWEGDGFKYDMALEVHAGELSPHGPLTAMSQCFTWAVVIWIAVMVVGDCRVHPIAYSPCGL